MAATAPQINALLDGWTALPGALYAKLASALATAIEDGRLPAGTRLPPERQLSADLAVSRSTVAGALDDLAARGLLDRRQGSGTFVAALAQPASAGRTALVRELDDHAVIRDLSGGPEASVELLAAAVDCAPEVTAEVATLEHGEVQRWTRGHGYVPLGLPALREAIAAHLSVHGLATSPDQVIVTTGAVEAVLLAARLFVEPGDPVAVEAPSYIGALDVLRSVGGRLLGIDVDERGARTDQLAAMMARSRPRLVYVIPDFQNPTGVVLSEPRRREIARLAAEHRVPVIEDLVQHELWFDTPPPAPIAATDSGAPVLTLGSMSKVFWGGLRVGWVRSDPGTVERLGRIKTVTNYGTPAIDQLVSARLLPQVDAIAARRREQLASGLATLETAVAEHLPEWRWRRPEGGLSMWLQLPVPVAPALARSAERHGVAIATGASFGIAAHDHYDRVRLPFVADAGTIVEGVRRLGVAWDDLTHRSGHDQPRAVVV